MIKITGTLLLALISSAAFATKVNYSCPSQDSIKIRDYDGSQWQLTAPLKKEVNGQVSVVEISGLTIHKPRKIEELDRIYTSQWSGGYEMVACHYYGAPSLFTGYSYNPGKNCKLIEKNLVQCEI